MKKAFLIILTCTILMGCFAIETAALPDSNNPSLVTLSSTSITIPVGETWELTATVLPATAYDRSVTWSTNFSNIARVNSQGVVTGVSPGNAIITATTSNGKTASCYVEVEANRDTCGLKDNSTYYIKNVFSGRYLEVANGTDSDDVEVIPATYNGQYKQQWTLDLYGDGKYKIASKCGSGERVIDTTYGTPVIRRDFSLSSQVFTLTRQETLLYGYSGVFYIKCGEQYLISDVTGNLSLTSASNIAANYMWSFEEVNRGGATIYNFSEFIFEINENWYDTNLSSMGYQPYYYVDTNRLIALETLKIDSIFFHTGHGSPGLIYFQNNGTISASDVDNLSYNELAGLRCFITLGCSAGSDNALNQNIVRSVYNQGAQFALGFTHTQYTPIAETWLYRFIDHAEEGYTVKECLQYADFVATIPGFGTGTKKYYGDDMQVLNR